MHIRSLLILIFLATTSLLIGGCSTSAWYEGMKQGAVNDCEKQPPGARNDCLSRVNTKPYDSYEKERAATKQ